MQNVVPLQSRMKSGRSLCMACVPMPATVQRIIHVLSGEECKREVRTSGSELWDATINAFTCIRALTAWVRCGRVRLLRLLLAVEHDEPAVDAGSDSVGEGVTISISASASKISLGWIQTQDGFSRCN
jgi:hypothetical protein